ncbi:MAG: MFS transporter [Actinobacteria bacterium]|nr:MFS transporter [Actinomycetota bacterium]
MPTSPDTVDHVLTTYRRALELPGAWQFSASALVGRLPMAMVGLAIVLLISERTGSYALAGILSAAFQVAAAGGGLVSSRWVDQLGQGRLLPWFALAHAAGLLAFVAAVETDQSVAVQIVTAAIAGLTQPAIGSMVRARWAFVAPDPVRLRSAFALESIVDELIFTIGPLLVAFLAFRVALPLPLIVAAVLTVAGSLALAAQKSTQPPPSGRADRGQAQEGAEGHRSALTLAGMPLMVVASLGIGAVFGSYEVSVVAFAEEAGQSGASGLILGLWAAGSLLGGVVFGARQWSMDLPRQVVSLTGILALALLVSPLVGTIPLLALVTFVAGIAVAPALIAVFSLTERLVPAPLLTEGLTWTNSGLALGFSLGTSIAGIVIDVAGTTPAFLLAPLCAGAACLTAALGQGQLRRASAGRAQPLPGRPLNSDPVPGPSPGGVMDDPDVVRDRGEGQ